MIIFRRLWRNFVSRGLGPRGEAAPADTSLGCIHLAQGAPALTYLSAGPVAELDIEAGEVAAMLLRARPIVELVLTAEEC